MKWISVKERLPEKYGDYLTLPVYRKDRESYTSQFHVHNQTWTKEDENAYDYKVEITHWMPLPEPPTEEA